MNRRRSMIAAALMVVCLALCAGPAVGGEAMHLPAFGDVVDVRVINLEVVVTRRGERVAGLRAEDFSLRVDGQEVDIEFFSEVAGGRAVAPTGPRRPDGVGLPAPVPGADAGTRYVLFIDDDFALPTDRNRVLAKLAEQVSALGDDDRMAVVAFDGRRLELLSHWTRSLSQLKTVLSSAQQRRAYGMLRHSQLKNTVGRRFGSRQPGGAGFSSTGFLGLDRARAGVGDPAVPRYGGSHGEIAQVVRAATSTLRGFAGAPGRKVMLLLAGGWPVYGSWGDRGIFDLQDRERHLFAPLVETANRLGYTLYPVDLQGGTYDTSGRSAAYGSSFAGRAGAVSEREREQLSESALQYLAQETGGRALFGGAKLTALERTIEDTRSYYWLGFTPAWQGDGAHHRLQITARSGTEPGEKLKVRTRRGFSDLSRQTEVSMWIESAHLFDTPLPDSGELTVEVGKPRPAGLGKLLLPISLEVPLDQVTVLPVGDGSPSFVTSLELRIAATDADGASADMPVTRVELRSREPPKPGQIGIYETRLRLRRAPHRLLISLYDPLTSSIWTRRLDFAP